MKLLAQFERLAQGLVELLFLLAACVLLPVALVWLLSDAPTIFFRFLFHP